MRDEFILWLHGVDGSRWALHGEPSWGQDVVLTEGSLGDLYEAPISTTFQPRVGQPGATYLGHRFLERHVVLSVVFKGDRWAEEEARFRRAVSPSGEATLVVRTSMSGERQLKVRLAEAPSFDDKQDPYSRGAMVKKFVFTAGNPYWEEPNHVTSECVFDGTRWVGDVEVDNPTDVECWPKWVLTSPARFGLPDHDFQAPTGPERMVFLPYQKAGKQLVVDTDPLEEMVVASDRTLVWAQMNGQFFQHPIPPGVLPTRLPVMLDPMPQLKAVVPNELRVWVATKLSEWLKTQDSAVSFTQVAAQVETWVKSAASHGLPAPSAAALKELKPAVLAGLLEKTYGPLANMSGVIAQVRMVRRWQRPWG